MSYKTDRIAKNIQREIGLILLNEAKNQEIRNITITEVSVTNDLSFSKIYFTIIDESKKKETIEALEKAKGYIRSELADVLEIRHIPKLIFIYDESIAYGNKIEDIIKSIKNNNEEA